MLTSLAEQPRWLPQYDFLVSRESGRLDTKRTASHNVVKRRAKAAMVVILKRDEAERLEYAIIHLPHWAEYFGHTVHWPRLRLKCNFYEVAFSQRVRKVQQASGGGYGLEFRLGTAAVFQPDCSQDGIS